MDISHDKKDRVKIDFIGDNAESVTGSCTRICHQGNTYLFECGMSQEGKTILGTYRINQKILQRIRPQEISFIIVGHLHLDHHGLIPALFSTGRCHAKIILPAGSTAILKEMWLDAAHINQRDSDYLTLTQKQEFFPLFTEEDVKAALSYVEEVPSQELYKLNDFLTIRYIPAGHIFLSHQCELFIGQAHIHKILFTSDLGNLKNQRDKFYLEPFQPVPTASIVIGECTYAARSRSANAKDYKKDLEKISTVIKQYCIDHPHRVLIPVFSLDRTPYMLWIIYWLFKDDPAFTVPILVDSPLAIRLLYCYLNLLSGTAKEMFSEMLAWKNLKLVADANDSRAAIEDHGPKVILSSSGMLTAGRSVHWTSAILPHHEDCILFCGFSGPGTLAHSIKHSDERTSLVINGKSVKNRCQIVDLKSFSSHMQREDLINYYKGIRCNKIYLVHADQAEKLAFKADLEAALSESLRSTRVIAANRSTSISL